MSRPGHCRHCKDGCVGGFSTLSPMHTNGVGASWFWECCPACAVADLIDAELRPLSEDGVIGWKRIGLTIAARIARGES